MTEKTRVGINSNGTQDRKVLRSFQVKVNTKQFIKVVIAKATYFTFLFNF